MSQATFDQLKNKCLLLAQKIVEDESIPYAQRLKASVEIRQWLGVGSFPRQEKPQEVPLSPEEERELIETFKRLDRDNSDSDY